MLQASGPLSGILQQATSSVLGGSGGFSLPSIGGLDLGGVVDLIRGGGRGDALVSRLGQIGAGLLQNADLGPLSGAARAVAGGLMDGDFSPARIIRAAGEAGLAGNDPVVEFIFVDAAPSFLEGKFDLDTAANGLTALGVELPPFAQMLLSLARGGNAGLIGGGASIVRTPDFNPGA